MNKNVMKLLSLLLVAAVMATALLGCKAKEEPKATEPTTATEIVEAPVSAEPEATQSETEAMDEEVIIETEPEVEAPEAGSITYEEYLALEVLVQQAYYEKFDTPDDFFVWLNAAKAEYESATEQQPTIGAVEEETEEPTTSSGGIYIEDEGVEDWE